MPRGSVYAALARLEEKGAAVRVETPEGTRYAPVPAQEVVQGLAARFQRTLGQAEKELNKLSSPPERDHVWNASGYAALLEHSRAMIDRAKRSLLLAVWPQESAAVAEQTEKAAARGVDIETLCLAGCPRECGACRGRIYRYDMMPVEDGRRLMIVPDEQEVLAGEITSQPGRAMAEGAQIVRTRQPLVVDLAAGYIRHSIALALLLTDAGRGRRKALRPETRARLAALSADARGRWLERLQDSLEHDRSEEEDLPAPGSDRSQESGTQRGSDDERSY